MKNLYHSSWLNVATAFGISFLTLLGIVSMLLFSRSGNLYLLFPVRRAAIYLGFFLLLLLTNDTY